jgi:asparagine synthase (glutamine-hydrolysing)
MPGIFGVVDGSGRNERPMSAQLLGMVETMAAAMRYESSYTSEILVCPELAACVGWVGRAGGAGGRVTEVTTGIALVTSGEATVADAPPPRWGNEDPAGAIGAGARALAWSYRRAGERAIERAGGVFAGFLMDPRRATCLLFNDRYGAERLFLHQEGERTFFASEAKAILAVAPATRAFDADGLAQFLACGCTLGSRSLFRGIEVLEGGALLRFAPGKPLARHPYFDRSEWEALDPVAEDGFVPGFSDRLKTAVAMSTRRPPAVGISLTAGLDSRMIMACLDAAPGEVPCYTFGSMYRETFDVSAGRQVATLCRQPHQVLELGRGFVRDAARYLSDAVFISDGYLGMSGAAELYCNRLARSIAPVRITGNWGGELLRGVRAFKHLIPPGDFLSPDLVARVAASDARFRATGTQPPLSFTLFHQLPHQGYGRYAIERSQVVMRSPFLDDELVRWLYRAPAGTSGRCAVSVIARERPALLAIATDQGLLGAGGAGAQLARGLYRRAVIKGEYMVDHGAPHWLASLMRRVPGLGLEAAFLGRNKFQHFRGWFGREWADFVRDTLLGDGRTGLDAWFDMGKVERMVEHHRSGWANHTDELDKLLTVAVAGGTLLRAGGRP